jgi:hypothetical protein
VNAAALVPNLQRQEAFDALTTVVEQAREKRSSTYAASVKPRLKARLPSFDESALGYDSFRAFLTDAEQAGRIRLTFTRGGDVEISLTNDPPREVRRIRPDLWAAATDEQGEGKYFYDARIDRVAARPRDGEQAGLVEIPSADSSTQSGWIEQFLSERQDTQPELAEKVRSVQAISEKLEILNVSAVAREWHAARLAAVLKLLTKWSSEQGLAVDLADGSRSRAETARNQRPTARRPTRRGNAEQLLRERLHQAVDRMPISELLRLPVPLEYTVDL